MAAQQWDDWEAFKRMGEPEVDSSLESVALGLLGDLEGFGKRSVDHSQALAQNYPEELGLMGSPRPKGLPREEDLLIGRRQSFASSTGSSVKATTTERLGFTGRGEGIAAQAVVLLEEI